MVFDANGNLLEVDDGGIYRLDQPECRQPVLAVGERQPPSRRDAQYRLRHHFQRPDRRSQDNGTEQQFSRRLAALGPLFGGDGGDVVVDDVTLAASGQSIRYISAQYLLGFNRQVYDAANNLISTTNINIAAVTDAQFLTPSS